jgi:hypothetical protein
MDDGGEYLYITHCHIYLACCLYYAGDWGHNVCFVCWEVTVNVVEKQVFHIAKPISAVSFVDVETTDKVYSEYLTDYKQLRRQNLRSPGTILRFWKLKEKRKDRQIDPMSRIAGMKSQFNFFDMHCVIHFFQSFMNYTAVC